MSLKIPEYFVGGSFKIEKFVINVLSALFFRNNVVNICTLCNKPTAIRRPRAF